MAEVALQSHFPSPTSSPPTPCFIHNDALHQPHTMGPTCAHQESGQERLQEEGEEDVERKEREGEGDQLSLVALLVSAFRRSLVGCSIIGVEDFVGMEIGLPTNVRHVAHVTFDRFNGFLGLPVEFEPEVPRRAPSASATAFGVSTESMQLSYDSRGNSVPTILLMMQRHLYAQGGLQAEGIFRITAGNSQEEYVREQLNKGVIPEGVDAHCLSGLIKAWFRELPNGILDPLPPEAVMQCQTEEECVQLARLLPPTETALLDWAVNLMADVVQMEHLNKMNARNIAMVFAPNMTQMSDPLTALMYAVQVMNFLKTLIVRTLKDREESSVESVGSRYEPSDKNDPQSSSRTNNEENKDDVDENDCEKEFAREEPALDNMTQLDQNDPSSERGSDSLLTSIENVRGESWSQIENHSSEVVPRAIPTTSENRETGAAGKTVGSLIMPSRSRPAQSCNIYSKKCLKKPNDQNIGRTASPTEKGNGASIMGRINSRTEMFEAWR